MSKSKPIAVAKADLAEPAGHGRSAFARTFRDIVEGLATAFILAFLFRTFLAEPFVIPTGSMAPTLMGRHKDVFCPQCQFEYSASASSEVDRQGNRLENVDVQQITCPVCRFPLDVDPRNPELRAKYPSYTGDRIVVSKLAYDFGNPERWDVVVFKFPLDAKTNYIKRLVGLPNERLQIYDGDIYTAPLGAKDDDLKIVRKTPDKIRSMLQLVYDNDYQAPPLLKADILRWRPWNAPNEQTDWKLGEDFKLFHTDGGSMAPSWIRYQHLLPTPDIWRQIENGRPVTPLEPSPIHDFYAYNSVAGTSRREKSANMSHWVSDLALECQLEVKEARGAVIFELVKAGAQLQCRLDLATGVAKLSISQQPNFTSQGQTIVKAAGTYDVLFSNVDEELRLWINGEAVEFDGPTTYPPLESAAPKVPPGDLRAFGPGSREATDLSPAGIGVEGGAAIAVNHLRLWRDLYYTADFHDRDLPRGFVVEEDESRIVDLKDGQFFMVGDNSPASADSRYWGTVDRNPLVGKALYVFWPHSFDKPIPFWPNFGQMRYVR